MWQRSICESVVTVRIGIRHPPPRPPPSRISAWAAANVVVVVVQLFRGRREWRRRLAIVVTVISMRPLRWNRAQQASDRKNGCLQLLRGSLGYEWRGSGSDRPTKCHRRHLPGGQEVLVFLAVLHLHLPCGTAHRVGMAPLRLHLLQTGGRPGAQRSQAERAEGCQAGQAGVRGYFYDGGQGLGGRADIRTNYHR